MKYLFCLLVYVVVHIIAARLGFYINDLVPGVNTFFWPPAGISLAVLLLFGYKFLPGMFVGGLVASLLYGGPLPVAISSAVGSTLAPFLAALIAKKAFNVNTSLQRTRDVVGLLLVAVPLSSVVLASLITVGFLRGRLIEPADASGIWVSIWICNILSANIISSFILVWFRQFTIRIRDKRRILESAGLIMSVTLLAMYMFTNTLNDVHFVYFIIAPLVWAALRYGVREVVTILFVFSVLSVWSTIIGRGPSVITNINSSLLYLEGFISVISFTSMILAVTVAERKEHEQRKDNFISMASHELRTPLTSVKIMTQVLVKKNKNKDEKKYLEKMDQQLDKLSRLINEMLDLSKIQAKKLELRKETFSLDVLLDQLVDTMSMISPSHKVIVQGNSLLTVHSDRDRIEQVLLNLLSNAVKYSPKADKIVITVKSDKKNVVIGVQDYGIGIPRKHLDKIFERFYRVDQGHEHTGFGLGLFISVEIIKQHEGKIWVESQRGKGSAFYFSLPLT